MKGEVGMELYFMAVAILLLTLMASYAIRRAEREMIERHNLDRPAPSGPPISHDKAATGTKVRA